ncbi:MAG: hypothetical protein Q8N27_06400 [Candidatus Hydromicrobium sp.]|nr:hypothetical protein [Candidatus Hydromicrobium sp.]
MCEMHEFNPDRFSGCGCGHMYGTRHSTHSDCCSPIFPSKKEQIERLKDYKQTLQDKLDEVENRLKDLG